MSIFVSTKNSYRADVLFFIAFVGTLLQFNQKHDFVVFIHGNIERYVCFTVLYSEYCLQFIMSGKSTHFT